MLIWFQFFNSGSLAADSATPVILALNLLHLLVENRLADFHCEVCPSFYFPKIDGC